MEERQFNILRSVIDSNYNNLTHEALAEYYSLLKNSGIPEEKLKSILDPRNTNNSEWEEFISIMRRKFLQIEGWNMPTRILIPKKKRKKYLQEELIHSSRLIWINAGSLDEEIFDEETARIYTRGVQRFPAVKTILIYSSEEEKDKNYFVQAIQKTKNESLIINLEKKLTHEPIITITKEMNLESRGAIKVILPHLHLDNAFPYTEYLFDNLQTKLLEIGNMLNYLGKESSKTRDFAHKNN